MNSPGTIPLGAPSKSIRLYTRCGVAVYEKIQDDQSSFVIAPIPRRISPGDPPKPASAIYKFGTEQEAIAARFDKNFAEILKFGIGDPFVIG
jgi:hypothetical protein